MSTKFQTSRPEKQTVGILLEKHRFCQEHFEDSNFMNEKRDKLTCLPRRHCSIYQTRQRCLFLDVQYWKWIADEARSRVTRCIAKCFISHKAKWLNDQLKIWQKSPQVHKKLKKLSHKWSTESAMKSSANPADERGLQPSIRGKRSSFRSTKSKSNVSFSVLKILSIIILIIVLCFLVTFSVNAWLCFVGPLITDLRRPKFVLPFYELLIQRKLNFLNFA